MTQSSTPGSRLICLLNVHRLGWTDSHLLIIWIQVCFYQHILNSDQLTPIWPYEEKEKLFKVASWCLLNLRGGRSLPRPEGRSPSGMQIPPSVRCRAEVIWGRPLRGTGTLWTSRRSTCCNWVRRSLSHTVWPCSFCPRPPLFLRCFRYTGDQRLPRPCYWSGLHS